MFIQLQSCRRSFAVVSAFQILCVTCVCLFPGMSALSQENSLKPTSLRKSVRPASVVPAKSPGASITVFDAEQGLALASVFTSLKDSNGNLWFGTLGGGVSKYDGRSFQNYTAQHGLADNIVMSILEDRHGDLWFATFGGGVSRFDGISFKTYSSANGLATNVTVSTFEDSRGHVWLGTFDGGVSRYDGKKFDTFNAHQGLANDSVWSIAEDDKGILYFGTDDGVFSYDGKSFMALPGLKKKSVRSILFDAQGNLWFGTIGEGVYKQSPTGITHYTTRDGLPDNSIWHISQDAQEQIWFGTETGGAAWFDGERFFPITTREGLSDNNVTSITEDDFGSIWISTFGGGVNRFEGRSVSAFDTRHGLASSKIRNVTEDRNGNLWIGSFGGGLIRFDGRTFDHYDTTSGLPSNFVRTILETRKGVLWVGFHGGGLSKFDGNSFTNYNVSSGLANDNVRSLYEDADGAIWVGTDNGLSRIDGNRIQSFRQQDGLPHAMVWDILQDKNGNYWFGTYGGGLILYDGKSFKAFTTADGLNSNSILCLQEDRNGSIWIGGVSGGVTRFDGQSFLTYTKRDGLPDETVYDILESQSGEVWFGTNLGITRLSFVGVNNDVVSPGQLAVSNDILRASFKPKCDVYSGTTGYRIKDINTNAMCIVNVGFRNEKEGRGHIWAGCGDDRLIRFDPTAIRTSFSPPKVTLHNVKVNDLNISWYGLMAAERIDSTAMAQREAMDYGHDWSSKDRAALAQLVKDIRISGVRKFSNVPTDLILPHRLNRVTFDYSVIETSRYGLINYQYKLDGQDDRWSPVVRASQVTYSNLWEGDYTFTVRGQSAEGIWGDPITFSFTVSPPWWREPWMYLLYVVGFIFLVTLVTKARERKLKKERDLLERIVEQRTNEVVEQMRAVELQKNEAQRQRHEAERHRLLVEQKNTEIVDELAKTEASLSSLTLEMIDRFHAYSELELELKVLAENSDPNKFKRIFSLITTNKSLDREWEQFNLFFDGIYKDFNNKLRGRTQQLSNYDLRLCALVKMGFENREIAMLLNIEVTSVKMAKYRLRKKFQIEEAVDLQQYFKTL
ncbi:MAG TPA: two-component regulator propeller domain-containing protein [Chryseosolibacter sp.]